MMFTLLLYLGLYIELYKYFTIVLYLGLYNNIGIKNTVINYENLQSFLFSFMQQRPWLSSRVVKTVDLAPML